MGDNEATAVTSRKLWTAERLGAVLVFGSAFFWSFGGAISRFLHIEDSWTIVFWRGLFAGLFLLAFMLLRDGLRGTAALFRDMGLPGMAVGMCFAMGTTCFIVAIGHTTIANVILLGACVPLFAALMVWLVYGERITPFTWAAIAAVMVGVAIMISGSFTGKLSPFGDALALVTAVALATATVITRRHPGVHMTPAVCFGCLAASAIAATQASALAVSGRELGILFIFGTLNLGLGMALFATGARLIPSALAALLGTAETMLGPVWVAVIHGELPNVRAAIGGGLILVALFSYLTAEFRRQQRAPASPP